MSSPQDGIFSLVQHYIIKRFEGMINEKGYEIKEVPENVYHENTRIDHRSEIFIYGTDVTVRLQFFFNLQNYIKKIAHLFEDGATDARVEDFFNELANMTLGKTKEMLVNQGVSAALSLPISVETAAVKSNLLSEVLTHRKDYSISKEDKITVLSRVSLVVHKPEVFKGFDWTIKDQSENAGDVELF